MIRRAAAGAWEAGARAPVPGPSGPTQAEPEPVDYDALILAAYERGRDEAATEAAEAYAASLQAHADHALRLEHEVRCARDELFAMASGIEAAISTHASTIEGTAIEVACAAVAAVATPLVLDASIVRAMCEALAATAGDDAILYVGHEDQKLLPESVAGVRIVVADGNARGWCRLVTGRGEVRGDIGERLDAILVAYRAAVEAVVP
jgi:hypothetical protein